MRTHPLLVGIALLALAGCFPDGVTTPTDNETSSSSSQQSSIEETKNVLYRGLLQEAGVSVFMQGSHRLVLDDGRFILLESEDVNLNHYLDENVEVFGAVRPTIEQGGLIMRVQSVKSLESSSSSSDSSDESTSSDDSSSSLSSNSSTSSVSSLSSRSSSSSSSIAPTPVVNSSSVAAWDASEELTAKAAIMAKDKMGAEFWSQTYCSSHIGYCIPVHKNWWFNSFGATSTSVWHVEIGPSEMNNIGEGPLTVRLVTGDISTSGMTDGQVSVSGGSAVGVRSWTGNRHFEVRGPANIETAVRYITQQLKSSGN